MHAPRPKSSSHPRVLIVLHQENSTPGRVGQELVKRGFNLDIRKPRFGDVLPSTLEDHAGAVIFGGPMSANDTDAFVQREIDWISVPLKQQKPFLGICLGAQMMVKQLGGTVAGAKNGQVEIGYYGLQATPAGESLINWPLKVYQWHREGFSLPSSCELLARGTGAYVNQAIRYGANAYGIQFHPELTHSMMVRWTTKAAERMTLPGAQQRRDHFAGRFIYDPAVKSWLDRFLDLWIGTAEAPSLTARLHAAE
ncbi:GMP synthase (glutamine-hydrolysing) [Roseibium hamelinense]|uniref:GMP synthase (Glutamine-hydrolysing) n=1 Tax=Roseibium hamelinense TaxID=150831 RepID=A0A562SLU2_9HYPH|nr:glutamine amidotransferase [Roseibium hamelinense]MTI43473.1 glutamine amidotransferase [Roseibium hamelinense]TWI81934.1 GMP synthase (glutamine-hydrolysing) [Roseibium hamelinense]